MNTKETRYIDSLLPPEMAVRAEEIGARKAAMAIRPLFALSVLAGAFIAFGAVLSTTVTAGAEGHLPYGLTRLISGFAFSLGLVLVVIGGAELFTGNNLIVMAWANRRISTVQVLRNWLIVYVGNFVGAFGAALLVYFSGQYSFGKGAVGAAALSIAKAKTGIEISEAVALGILCNVLVCLAVWMSYSGRTTADKVLAVVPPVSAFVASGFEHSIANMYFVPIALLIKWGAPDSFWSEIGHTPADFAQIDIGSFLFGNLLPVTLGNIVGGAVLVGIVYWFVYLRGRRQQTVD